MQMTNSSRASTLNHLKYLSELSSKVSLAYMLELGDRADMVRIIHDVAAPTV